MAWQNFFAIRYSMKYKNDEIFHFPSYALMKNKMAFTKLTLALLTNCNEFYNESFPSAEN